MNSFIGVTALLYSLSNPIGVIPIFLKYINHSKNVRSHRIILIATSTVATLLCVAALFGREVLAFFDVGLDNFRIAGGLLALFIAFEMFQARYGGIIQTSEEQKEAEDDIHGIAITPLAFPLLVGPAEMSIVMTLANDRPDWIPKLMLVLSSVSAAILIGVTLWLATPINRLIGKTGVNIATRIMALIVASIGVQFIVTGIHNQF